MKLIDPPGRQGPGPVASGTVARLELSLARRAGGQLPGERRAPGVGAGTELAQLRPYEPGDDPRQLDPAASARTGVAHVRQHVPERALTTWVVLDLSASMAFGTGLRLKSDVAEGVATTIGQLAVRRGGRVAVITAGVPASATLPPRSGRGAFAAVRRLVGAGVSPDATAPKHTLSAALTKTAHLARTPGLITVVSDFREEGWPAPLRALAGRHAVTAVEITDPREAELPDVGQIVLVDPETGRTVEADTTSGSVRAAFAAAESQRRAEVAQALRRARAHHVTLSTGEDWLRTLGAGTRMTLASPINLLALMVIPVVVAAYAIAHKRRRQYAVRFPAAAVFARAAGRRPLLRRALPSLLLAGAAVALAVGFAKPQATQAAAVERASVVLVTDESGSMSATDVQPSRLAAAQSAAQKFLDRVPGKLLVGFVGFSSQTNTVVEPTTDRGEVSAAVDSLQADGATATGDALNAALDRLEARRGNDGKRAPAAVVLLSDGQRTGGSDPLVAAQRAKRLGIRVSTVALGTPDATIPGPLGEPIPVPPDPETLRQISQITGGSFTEAASAGDLSKGYERLGSKVGTKRVTRDVSSSFAAAGLILLLGGLGTGVRWRPRVA